MKQHEFRYWAPLINFQPERKSIKLRENLQISEASEDEKHLLYGTNMGPPVFLLRLTLEKEEPQKKPSSYFPDARTELERAIFIVRLFKAQLIGFNIIVQQYPSDASYSYNYYNLLHYMLWASQDSALSREPYVLQEQEIDEFTSFFKAYDLPAISEINLAMNYFNKSYYEPYAYRDSCLDIFICLEHLFLKDTNQELSYKLSMRMAHLLGENAEERHKIFRFIKEKYGLRSKVVHGSVPDELTEEDFFQLRDYSRKSIKYLLKNITLWSGEEQDKIIRNSSFCPSHCVDRTQ